MLEHPAGPSIPDRMEEAKGQMLVSSDISGQSFHFLV